ncbi:polymorphic toxin-type HINT domain-containing protein [Paludisphaera mucosa]|uniref:Polymorphic toxin-type HINT domain-containing protein n=1 Tax=Paludisphaera mucosa TaxID=3030827 RepID=A0ABT6FJQ3_9BACT|nr:polymorphic toxin-type HINT domain-containing protein [Paludisphaera mucosa]MDG3007806.1 polymorphic toxin-type HINT domain-containing protein [Paludisphaera mucosa]
MMSAWALSVVVGLAGAADESAKPDLAAYESAKASAGRDAEAQVRLALWCESRGMAAERTTHLMRAVLIDPENARARGLLGQVKHDGRWLRPADVARAIEESPAQQALLREYLDRRATAGDDADTQYKLALWCEEKGLTQPMVAHLRRVVQLDPGREGAWRRLGFRKAGDRWVDPEAEAALKAEREVQAKADRAWKPRLETLRTALGGKNREKRDEVRAAVAAVADPRAVPMLWRVFARGGDERRQSAVVEAFGRIEGPGAATALAMLALSSPHAAIRSDAAVLLQRRDPREFAAMLAASIRDEVKYKVKPVEGPGSRGELLVEGEAANVRRLYTPLDRAAVQPGDEVWRDEDGKLVANRPFGPAMLAPVVTPRAIAARMLGLPVEVRRPDPDAAGSEETVDPATGLLMPYGWGGAIDADVYVPTYAPIDRGAVAATLEKAGVPSGLSRTVAGQASDPRAFAAGQAALALYGGGVALDSLQGDTLRPIFRQSVQMPVERMAAEARESAVIARERLARDVATIEAYNAPIRQVNERAVTILKAVSGEDRGDDREKWMGWVLDLQGYGQPLKARTSPPAEIVEQVPLGFQPQAFPVPSAAVVGYRIGPSCFAGGTPVRTLQGDRPIEQVRPGDQVLTQDTTTGRLAYRPVVEVMHNPPNWTYAIDLGKETVHPTGIHRFWKAGHGWVMARDVKAGDRLRTIGGTVEVVSTIKGEEVQPVFNLLLSGGDNYCVGTLGVIAHDNGFVDPVAAPFDGVPATAELVATSKP